MEVLVGWVVAEEELGRRELAWVFEGQVVCDAVVVGVEGHPYSLAYSS